MIDPTAPLTAWVLLSAGLGAAVVGVPLLLGLLSYRRASREGQVKDITALVGPVIAAQIKEHNEELYAHPAALARYTTMEIFNAALRELRSEISGLKTTIEANEVQRREDVKTFREDFRDLKANVSRAIGDKGERD